MRDAAEMGMVITLKCHLCRSKVSYLAADLVEVVGPEHEVHVPPFICSRCKVADSMAVSWTVVPPSQLDGLVVRRPVRRVTRWIWRNEQL